VTLKTTGGAEKARRDDKSKESILYKLKTVGNQKGEIMTYAGKKAKMNWRGE